MVQCGKRGYRAVMGLVLSVLFGMLAGCSSEPRADKGGEKLLIYATFEHEQVAQYLQAFAKAHPEVSYDVIVDSHGVIMAKLLAEKASPKADVIFGLSAFNMEQLKSENLLAPLELENLASFLPGFRDPANPPYYVGLSGVESVLIVNEKELKKRGLPTPSSYADLLKPEYRALITMPNPASSGTGFLSIVGFLSLMGEDKGWEYMRALDRNIALYTHSGSKPARLAASGEYPIGISLGYRGHKMLEDATPIAMIFPAEGYGWDLESLALLAKPVRKESARTFLSWASSAAAMELYASNNVLTASKTDAPLPLGYESNAYERIAPIDFAHFASRRDEMLKQWESLFRAKNEGEKSASGKSK